MKIFFKLRKRHKHSNFEKLYFIVWCFQKKKNVTGVVKYPFFFLIKYQLVIIKSLLIYLI